MSEYIVNLDGELGMALAVVCAGAGFAREEIVRCRDCKHCMAYMAAAYCDYLSHAVDAELDGFCKWGERKDNGNS